MSSPLRTLASLIFLGLVLSPASAFADPINSDAPDVATGTFALAPLVYQLEQNVQVDFAAGAASLGFPSLHRFGLVESFELRLESPILAYSAAGLARTDIGLAGKWNLEKVGLPSVLPPLALLGAVTLDPANAVSPALTLLTDIELPLGLGLNANVGGIFPSTGAGWTYAASFSRDLTDLWRAYAEVAGGWDPAGGTQTGVDGGVMYLIDDDTQVMAAIQTDVNQPFNVWYVTTNYSHRWGK